MAQTPADPQEVLGIERAQMPRHIAIIMDGNGRWAKQRGLPRISGHAQGAQAVRGVVTECARLGVEVLTLYSFSHENWKRPKPEVDFLMALYGQYLIAERREITDNNVRLVHVGRRRGLPDEVLQEMDATVNASAQNTGLRLCLALNYGARTELVDAMRRMAADVKAGRLEPRDIDEQRVSDSLYTAALPDPDMLIRTAGEHRLSNFLLWQISYAELFVCDACWPDFAVEHLHAAIKEFARRDRRFGAVNTGS